jgi:anti-anti-sigma regulatory factor
MNSVELRTRMCGDHIVVAVRAELDICKAAATIAAIASRGPGREHCVIVDLQALDFID